MSRVLATLLVFASSLPLVAGCGGDAGESTGDTADIVQDAADAGDGSATDTGPVDTEPVDTEPLDTEPVDTEPVDTEPLDTEPVDTEPVDTEPVDTEPLDTEPVDTEPVDTEPLDTEPTDADAADAEPTDADTTDAEPDVVVYVPRPSAGCGTPNTLPTNATTVGTLSHDALVRSWRIHLPASYDGLAPVPLVLGLHGGVGSGQQFENEQARLNEVAQREGFLVVYPDGSATGTVAVRTWNAGECCGASARDDIDDVGYISALLDTIGESFCYDERRVYVTGISNGGMMSIRLACELSERVAAIAPVAAALTFNACDPSRPVPVMHIHGDADAHVPIEGGLGCGLADIEFKSLDQSMSLWADVNTCEGDPELLLTEGNGTCTTEGTCEAETVRCVVEGGGHDWHGGVPREGTLPACTDDGAQSQTFDASEQVWRFFERQQLPE